jgi:hypothetical protein
VTFNTGSYRVLSACLQVYYPGTELTRSGITAIGQSQVGSLSSVALTCGTVRSLANYIERTPLGCVELKWRPNSWDLEWTELAALDLETSSNFGRRSTIYSSTSGIPVSTGMRVRMVAVVEWQPLAGTGQPAPQKAVSSDNTFTQVLKVADSYGEWAYSGAAKVQSVAEKLYRAGTAVGHVAYAGAKMAALFAA